MIVEDLLPADWLEDPFCHEYYLVSRLDTMMRGEAGLTGQWETEEANKTLRDLH